MTIGKPYCSCVCCMQAIKNAILIKEKDPAMDVTICYMDIRSYGKGYEEYYERAKALGIRFLRGMPSDILADKNGMILQVENSETSEVQVLHPDLVVLSVGMGPAESMAELARKFGIALEDTGFVKTVHDAMDTTATLPPGDLRCRDGCCSQGYPGQRGLGRVGSNAGIPRCGQVAIGVNSSFTLWWDKKTGSIWLHRPDPAPERGADRGRAGMSRAGKGHSAAGDTGGTGAGRCGSLRGCTGSIALQKKDDGIVSCYQSHAMQRCSGQPARLRSTSGGGLTACWTQSENAPGCKKCTGSGTRYGREDIS